MFVLKIILLSELIRITFCANILALLPNKFKSHFIIFDSVLVELTKRGHNVTVVNPFPKTQPPENYTDIDISFCDETPLNDIFNMDQAFKSYDSLTQIEVMMSLVYLLEPIMKCPVIQKIFLQQSSDSYDLIITETFHTDVMLKVAKKFNAPIISFIALPLLPWAAENVGNPDNPSYIKYAFSDTPMNRENPTFHQRLWNTFYYIYAKLLYYLKNLQMENMAVKYVENVPKISEIAKNISLILSFSHFTFNAPVPLLPNVVEISGLQIKPVRALPKDIEKFINESEHGVIYFCMGSLLKSETMPEDKKQAFLKAFDQLPQRVIWKWGDDKLEGQTDNILIRKWMPQRDILAHPKVKLFISHGGALGLNEAVYEGVPVLGIPMYADQTTNLNVLKSYGAGEILQYPDIKEDTVLSKIRQVLKKEYKENMKKLSIIYKDRPMSPMDTAIYWVEYVIRHKGAHHLRSAAVNLPLYQYLLLDVIAFIALIILSLFFIFFYVIKKCLSIYYRKPSFKKKLQ